MNTRQINHERTNYDTIHKDFKRISSIDYFGELINALPYLGAILDANRQIVFANDELLNTIGTENLNNVLGQRPGETLNCLNAKKEPAGCGASESCKVCGVLNTFLIGAEEDRVVDGECRISAEKNGEKVSYEFKVRTTPIFIENKKYFVISLIDNSDEKRRRILEQIFFHDIINKAGSIKSLSELIPIVKDEKEARELIQLLANVSAEMIDEILAQRELSAAENFELKVTKSTFSSFALMDSLVQQIKHNQVSFEKNVIIDHVAVEIEINTDITLLKRVLLNMLKNALEASPSNSTITIGCKVNEAVNFWVHNPTYIPRDIQLQIFLRSFSTKGSDRGLGTYSIKLLGEKYLKGVVSFTTDKIDGTVFNIQLPK